MEIRRARREPSACTAALAVIERPQLSTTIGEGRIRPRKEYCVLGERCKVVAAPLALMVSVVVPTEEISPLTLIGAPGVFAALVVLSTCRTR